MPIQALNASDKRAADLRSSESTLTFSVDFNAAIATRDKAKSIDNELFKTFDVIAIYPLFLTQI